MAATPEPDCAAAGMATAKKRANKPQTIARWIVTAASWFFTKDESCRQDARNRDAGADDHRRVGACRAECQPFTVMRATKPSPASAHRPEVCERCRFRQCRCGGWS